MTGSYRIFWKCFGVSENDDFEEKAVSERWCKDSRHTSMKKTLFAVTQEKCTIYNY